jgi:hypothetical protein
MERKRRWPDRATTLANIEKGIIDDSTDAVPPYDLEEWEIRGQPDPGVQPEAGRPGRRRASRNTATPRSNL